MSVDNAIDAAATASKHPGGTNQISKRKHISKSNMRITILERIQARKAKALLATDEYKLLIEVQQSVKEMLDKTLDASIGLPLAPGKPPHAITILQNFKLYPLNQQIRAIKQSVASYFLQNDTIQPSLVPEIYRVKSRAAELKTQVDKLINPLPIPK